MVNNCLKCDKNQYGKKCQTWIDNGKPSIILNCFKFVEIGGGPSKQISGDKRRPERRKAGK